MRDGLLLRVIKLAARSMQRFDLTIARTLSRRRGEQPFVLGGECRRCARCCESPAIQVGRAVWYSRLLRTGFLAWQRRINGFELQSRDIASRTFVFTCTHFDAETRACDSYESRPNMCRDYPRLLLWQSSPDFFPECGYRAVAPNAGRLLEIIAGQALTEEQRKKLERGLNLER